MGEDKRSASLDAGNVKLTYNVLLEKAESRDKERIEEENKKLRKLEGELRSVMISQDVYFNMATAIHQFFLYLGTTTCLACLQTMSKSLAGFGRLPEEEEEEVAEVRRSLCMLQTAEEAAANTAWGPENPRSLVDKVDVRVFVRPSLRASLLSQSCPSVVKSKDPPYRINRPGVSVN